MGKINKLSVKQLMGISIILAASQVLLSVIGVEQSTYSESPAAAIKSIGINNILSVVTFVIIILLLATAIIKLRRGK